MTLFFSVYKNVFDTTVKVLVCFVVIKSFLGFLQVLDSVNNISIARYANAPVSSSICHTSLWLFFWPASSLILPIHWRPSHSVAPGAFEGSHQPPSQTPYYCSHTATSFGEGERRFLHRTHSSINIVLLFSLCACGDIHVNGHNTKALFRPGWLKFFPIGPLTHRWSEGCREPAYKAEEPLLIISHFLN